MRSGCVSLAAVALLLASCGLPKASKDPLLNERSSAAEAVGASAPTQGISLTQPVLVQPVEPKIESLRVSVMSEDGKVPESVTTVAFEPGKTVLVPSEVVGRRHVVLELLRGEETVFRGSEAVELLKGKFADFAASVTPRHDLPKGLAWVLMELVKRGDLVQTACELAQMPMARYCMRGTFKCSWEGEGGNLYSAESGCGHLFARVKLLSQMCEGKVRFTESDLLKMRCEMLAESTPTATPTSLPVDADLCLQPQLSEVCTMEYAPHQCSMSDGLSSTSRLSASGSNKCVALSELKRKFCTRGAKVTQAMLNSAECVTSPMK
jgi:hypothetical protein